MMSEHSLSSIHLLAELFLQPDPERDRSICLEVRDMLDAQSAEMRSILLQIQELCIHKDLGEDESSDFGRLFIACEDKILAPMNASFWLEADQHLMRSEQEKLEQLYARYQPEQHGDSSWQADHLVSELRLLAFLLRNDEARQEDLNWLLEHLCLWVPRFVRVVRASNPQPRFLLATALLVQVLSFWISFYQLEAKAVTELNAFIQISGVFQNAQAQGPLSLHLLNCTCLTPESEKEKARH
jgi:TorA maturation chaperone TorD